MATINRENTKRENEVSSHRNNDNTTNDKEENNTNSTCRREETIQMTTTQGPPVYSGPFSKFIALSENFQLPTILKPYDGTKDPHFHLTIFKSMMLINGASDPLFYKTFLTFLEKAALLWFSSLPIKTVHSFAELSQAFMNRFYSSQVNKKTLDTLNAIPQSPREQMREYLNQFNEMVM